MVKNRKATELKKIDQYSKAVANPELQSTYKNAQKVGFSKVFWLMKILSLESCL